MSTRAARPAAAQEEAVPLPALAAAAAYPRTGCIGQRHAAGNAVLMQPLQQVLQLTVRAVATILRVIVDELGKCLQPEALRRAAFVAKSFKLQPP
eukprot:CAMPEP_0181420964 /NCGR_PEP_ID=MMETSP1110-20121109/12857_1 /TAXON_ID=174948 /ORGANISM="Symbiodinium sp., Strain CCMP421" /LENGTH=94 /DNA_ID=CAMNT_0023544021 /DNA_START=157 /DNA_END=438 /DNA_ORIENTATION=-